MPPNKYATRIIFFHILSIWLIPRFRSNIVRIQICLLICWLDAGTIRCTHFIYPIQVACLRPAVLHIIRIGMRVFKTSAIPNASKRGAVLCPLNCFPFSINVYVVCQREHRLHSLCVFFQAIHRRVKIGIRYPHNHQCSI